MGHLTVTMQKLIIYSLNNGGIRYKSQDIYRSKKFYDAIRFLKRNTIIKPICTVCGINILYKKIGICNYKNKAHKNLTNVQKSEKHFNLTFRGKVIARYLQSIK